VAQFNKVTEEIGKVTVSLEEPAFMFADGRLSFRYEISVEFEDGREAVNYVDYESADPMEDWE
jgi:hypothetical protein